MVQIWSCHTLLVELELFACQGFPSNWSERLSAAEALLVLCCCRLRLIRHNSLCSSPRHKSGNMLSHGIVTRVLSRGIVLPLTGALYITIPMVLSCTTRGPNITNIENIWNCVRINDSKVKRVRVFQISANTRGDLVWVNHCPRNDLVNFQNDIVRIDQTSDDWCPGQ